MASYKMQLGGLRTASLARSKNIPNKPMCGYGFEAHPTYSQFASIRMRGFSLAELIVTMSIAGILLALAVPNFTTFLQNERASSQVNSLVASLDYARSEAIKRDTSVCVCASSDGATCSGGSWNTGWIVYTLAGDCTAASPVGTATNLINSVIPPSGTYTLNSTPAGKSYLGFLQSGLAGQALVSFNYCDSRGATYARYLEVNATGRVQAAPAIGTNISGTALTCP